jgi:hypothetical protein
VETEQSSLTLLVVAGVALLMTLTAVMSRRLEWKRPAPQRVEMREERATKRPLDEPRPSWPRILVISVPCAGAGIAGGVVLGSVASPATVASIAAALFVAVLAFAISLRPG